MKSLRKSQSFYRWSRSAGSRTARGLNRCVIDRLESRQLLAAAPFEGVKVNFQPAAATTVAGYVVDAGQTFGAQNGQSYGWNLNHADTVLDRGINGNQLLDTSVGVKQSGRWELAVPNGQYSVTVGVGDAAVTTKNNVWVEGSQVFNYQSLSANSFAGRSVTVSVTDGRLTLGVGSAASGQTRLTSIQVSAAATSTPPVSPPASPPPSPPTISGVTRINFQPAAAPTVAGYVVDAGQLFGSRNGLTYGWSASHTDAVYDRNRNPSQLLDTSVGIKAGTRWEVALPSGKYNVKVSIGDAGASSRNNVWLEGVQAYNYQSLAANTFASKTVTVSVTDGRLTIGVGGAATGQTKLNYLEITPASTPTPSINLGTILPLGDSITWGYEDKKTPTGGYRSRLYNKLSSAGASFTYTGSVVDTFASPLQAAKLTKHEGHGAYRTDQIAGNLLGIAAGSNVSSNNGGHWLDGTTNRPAIYPQIVLLHIGTNDILQQMSPSIAAANLEEIVKTLTTNRPNAKVFVSTIIPMLDAAKTPALKTYNQLLKDVVAKYSALGKKVTLVDMYKQFTDASGNARTGLYSDTVHPNRAGYDMIGDTWSAAILR